MSQQPYIVIEITPSDYMVKYKVYGETIEHHGETTERAITEKP